MQQIKPKSKDLIIAIDGYSSCGKSTLARNLATHLGYLYIDSGAMYRAVTLYSIQNHLFSNDVPDIPALLSRLNDINIEFIESSPGKYETMLCGINVEAEIRKPEVAAKVSLVSRVPEVRKKLVAIQQKLGDKKRIVMDGRDIGTVVFPFADIKFFMTADPEIRASRRLKELTDSGIQATLEEVLHNLKERDFIDENRDESPLKKADDAITLDNSNLSKEEQFQWVLEFIGKIQHES